CREGTDVQARVGWRGWRSLNSPQPHEPGYWRLNVERARATTAIRFRYRMDSGPWQAIAPLTNLERVRETSYVPKLTDSWQHECPEFGHGYVLMEATLESLLAGFEGGVFAPRSREEMFRDPIAREILRTDIPSQLAELGVDGIMAATTSSVADRSYLNPRYNYLTYDVADIHWQIGRARDAMRLVDTFYSKGIELVPDLVVAHQVRTPFPGSLDAVQGAGGERPFVDTEAFQHRDYGTWMFKLADANFRQQLVEKIVALADRYHLRILCLRYLDGLIYQYSKREINFGEIFLQELRAELKRVCPQVLILGEAFATKENPAVRACADIIFAPYGFRIVEQTFAPPGKGDRSNGLNFEALVAALRQAIDSQQQDAVYAMLHDETYQDEHVSAARPNTPWAYGSHPAELARRQGDILVEREILPREDLLDYVRRRVRNTEALTLFSTKLMYMFSPAVDSLVLENAAALNNWKFHWDDVTPKQLAFWATQGLSDRQTYLLHKQHRLDMVRLRKIFRNYTLVNPQGLQPLTQVHLQHTDSEHEIVSIWRYNPTNPIESIWAIFNLGFKAFGHNDVPLYLLPAPNDSPTQWEVLFDGDWIDPLLWTENRQHYLDTNYDVSAYTPGQILLENQENILPLQIGAHSLVILKAY
ncbi:MAG: hypothetical protein AAFY11_14020, partial [Cyanobacteria bacterium J06641_5]